MASFFFNNSNDQANLEISPLKVHISKWLKRSSKVLRKKYIIAVITAVATIMTLTAFIPRSIKPSKKVGYNITASNRSHPHTAIITSTTISPTQHTSQMGSHSISRDCEFGGNIPSPPQPKGGNPPSPKRQRFFRANARNVKIQKWHQRIGLPRKLVKHRSVVPFL